MFKNIVFIDADVDNLSSLVAGLRDDVAPILLDATRPAPSQIAEALAGRSGLESIHIVAHGQAGDVRFASGSLRLESVEEHRADLAALGSALAKGGRLLLWSCCAAQGARGAAFIESLTEATGAPVAASTGLVGAACLGGTWELDAGHPADASSAPLTWAGRQDYAAVMTVNISSFSSIVVAGDGAVNASEATTSFNVTGSAGFSLTGGSTAPTVGSTFTWYFTWKDTSGHIYQHLLTATVQSVSGNAFTWAATETNFSSAASTVLEGTSDTLTVSTGITGSTPSGTASTATFTYDKTAPGAPTGLNLSSSDDTGASTSDNITSQTSGLTVSGNGTSGTTVTLFDDANNNGVKDAGEAVLATTNVSGNNFNANLSLGEGLHHVRAYQTDAAGNVGASSTALDITVDTTAPGAPTGLDLAAVDDTGTSNSDNITKQTSALTFSGAGESGATVTLFDDTNNNGVRDAGENIMTTTSVSGGVFSADLSLAAGLHHVRAYQTDTAGNVSAVSAALDITVDTTAPGAPAGLDLAAADDSGASSTDNITSQTSGLTVSGTGENGATVTLFDDTNNNGVKDAAEAVLTTASAAGGVFSADLSLAEGLHHVRAYQTDTAGNVGAVSAALDITIDTTAFGAPTGLDLAAADDSGASNGDNITKQTSGLTVSGTGTTGASVTLFDDANDNGVKDAGEATLATTSVSGGVFSADLSLGEGLHHVRAYQTDTAGNVGASSTALDITIDATAPGAPTGLDLAAADDTGTSNSDNITSQTSGLTVSGSGESGTTVTLFEDTNNNGVKDAGEATLATTGVSGGTFSADLSLGEGLHHVRAYQTDTAGNVGAVSAALDITVDTTVLGAPTGLDLAAADDTGASSTDDITKQTSGLTVSGSGANGATVTLFDDANDNGVKDGGEAVLATTSVSGGVFSADLTLAAGLHHVRAYQETASNVGPVSTALDITIDTDGPSLTAALATDSGINGDGLTNDASLAITAEAGATLSYQINGSGGFVPAYDPATLADGPYSVVVRATDVAGNATDRTVAFTLNRTTTFTGNESAQDQTITNNKDNYLYFLQNSTAANAVVTNNVDGSTSFYDSTNAGTAQIHNNGGQTYFSDNSSADHATFVNEADGLIDFLDTSTAGNATITNGSGGTTYFENGASAGRATINNTAGATYFKDTSTASNATFSNTGAGFVDFLGSSTAGNATILNDAGALPAGITGSYTDFEGSSTADHSTITSINGGRVVFYGNSTGGNARLITDGATSSVEFSLTTGLNNDHTVSAGSISGSGTYYLGSNELTVGSLGLDDTVSGIIRDGGRDGGAGASLVKVGSGILTLSGNNAYTGGTTLVGGTLDLASATAAGSGALTFTSGAQSLAIETAALGTGSQHSFANTIAGFAADGDVIDLRGIGTATVSFDDATDMLTLTVGGQTAATLTVSGSFAGQYFKAVSDGHGGTNVTLVTNSAPTATPVTLAAIAEDSGARIITAAELLVGVSDVDPDTLTITELSLTSGSGSLVDNGGGSWTYTPAANDDTAASFRYTASDGALTASSTATLDLTPVNDAPTATPVTLAAIAEDSGARIITAAELLVGVSDVDPDTLTITELSLTSGSGSLVDNGGGSWTYTPAANDDTAASFRYTASDGALTASSTATLDLTPVNDAPTATPVTLAAIAEDSGARIITAAELLVGVSDVDPDTLTITELSLTSGSGSLVDNGGGSWTYTPAANDDTAASFRYTASDGALTASSTATLDLTPVNDAPVYQIDVAPASVAEGDVGSGNVLTYTVTRTGDIDQAGSVAVTLSGTAGSDDFTTDLKNGAVNFAAGASTATFTVTTTPDTIVEGDESVTATLGAIAGGGTLGAISVATATILNDDVPDTSPPVIASVSIPNAPLKIGSTAIATITVAADADSYSLVSGSVAGYALSNLQKVSNTTYTAQFAVTEGGGDYAAGTDLPVSLVVKDGAGNQNTAYTTPIGQGSDGIDAHRPTFQSGSVNGATLVLSYNEALDAGHPPALGAFTVLANNAPVGVTAVSVNAAAKTVTLSLLSAVQAGQAVMVAYTDPSSADDVNAVQDAAGNDAVALASTSVTNTTAPSDSTPPTVSVSVSDAQLTTGETATVMFQFSEAVTGFALNDVTAGHGQLSNFQSVDGDTYTALFTPAANYTGSDTIAVLVNSYADLANNKGAGGQIGVTINTIGGQAINGTSKNDTLVGTPGDDTIDGKAGADTMRGGQGNDTYFVDNKNDSVVENANAGTDTVKTVLHEYTLGANVENLTFIGTGKFDGAGNALANELTGGAGNDELDGKAGADTMTGGLGNDTYVVDNTGDLVFEQANEGTDIVYSSLSYTLGGNVENLSLTGSAAINGTGNDLANIIVGNGGINVLDGRGGADTLTGAGGHDTFAFRKGEANGDIVLDFQGAGKAVGDHLEFSGYGNGTLTRIGQDIYKITPDAAHGGAAAAETIRIAGVSNLDLLQGAGHNDILFV